MDFFYKIKASKNKTVYFKKFIKMEITLQPAEPKKKRTFLLKKRIEDAQNYTKSKDLRSKTFISSQNDNRNFLSRLSTKPPNYQNQNKTENEENESKANKLKKSKSILMLEKKSTFTSYDIQGPQLKINKRFLSFLVKTGLVSTESIDVSNNGSTAIYYEWNRIEKNFFIPSSLRDNEERFYCHHVIFFYFKFK